MIFDGVFIHKKEKNTNSNNRSAALKKITTTIK